MGACLDSEYVPVIDSGGFDFANATDTRRLPPREEMGISNPRNTRNSDLEFSTDNGLSKGAGRFHADGLRR